MNKQSGFTAFELLIVLAIGMSLAAGIGLMYVGIHFLAKFW